MTSEDIKHQLNNNSKHWFTTSFLQRGAGKWCSECDSGRWHGKLEGRGLNADTPTHPNWQRRWAWRRWRCRSAAIAWWEWGRGSCRGTTWTCPRCRVCWTRSTWRWRKCCPGRCGFSVPGSPSPDASATRFFCFFVFLKCEKCVWEGGGGGGGRGGGGGE